MKELEAIKARAEAATEGPWGLARPRPDGRNMVERRGYDLYGGEVSEMIIVDTNPSDAEFIAHARTDIPKLGAALEAVEAALVKQVEHFREFLGKDRESMQHIANSNRAFGADCALDAARQAISEALQ